MVGAVGATAVRAGGSHQGAEYRQTRAPPGRGPGGGPPRASGGGGSGRAHRPFPEGRWTVTPPHPP
ncbi:Hypothetical protein AA314_05974 [Archangium gephyra]|uniref:Uncharacterized protein n=1 Tax=Archangium gephyra TaxID=48 RepID=A0AAC8TFT4_9BACT|nr:Hypothetical protein AA314_05974 [Archangium gephyra]